MVLAIALLAACTSTDADGPLVTDQGLYELMVTMTPDPPVAGDATLSVMVHDADSGEQLLDADLAVSAWMPDHDHGLAEDPVVTAAEGMFTVELSYTMPGAWELTFDVDGSLGTDSAVLDVEVQ